jgi:hypothetical protein
MKIPATTLSIGPQGSLRHTPEPNTPRTRDVQFPDDPRTCDIRFPDDPRTRNIRSPHTPTLATSGSRSIHAHP